MTPPYAFVAGLLALLLALETAVVLPGGGSAVAFAPYGALLLLPAAFAAYAGRRLRAAYASGRPLDRRGRFALLRLAPASVPAVVWLALAPGGWLDLADRWSCGSSAVRTALLFLPVLVAETGRVLAEIVPLVIHGTAPPPPGGTAALPRLADCLPHVRMRLGWALLLCGPWFLLGVAADLAAGHRQAWVFFTATTPGLSLAALVFVLALAFVLPFTFRIAFGLRPLPAEHPGEALRRTADALGFPRRALLLMPTGMRALNAMLVGPLPWPRYLVLTDGLVDALDPHALTGVVAHEVGHARAGHPALLIALAVFVPLLLAGPLQQLHLDEHDVVWVALGALAVVTFALLLVRAIGNRFEHEADVLSVRAFGAEPCIRALQRVASLAPAPARRFCSGLFTLHPAEDLRIAVMRAFEVDPEFRERFARAGRRLRWFLAALVLASALAAAWSWQASWPIERAYWSFLSGDIGAARAQIAAVDAAADRSHPANDEEESGDWKALREEVAAAAAIVGDGGPWDELVPRFAAEGWRRGVEVMLREGPASARPWLALATADPDAPALHRSVAYFADAAWRNDVERMHVLHAHVQRLGYPPELAPVFAQ